MEGGKACALRDLFQGALALAKSLPKACSDGLKTAPPWTPTSVASISHAVLSGAPAIEFNGEIKFFFVGVTFFAVF